MRSCATIVVGLAAACAGPSMTVTTAPAEARIYVDGRRAGVGEVTMPNVYYGSHTVTAAPPLLHDPKTDDVAQPLWRASRQTVTLAEPVTPWLFPFDFVVELVTRPWRHPGAAARLELPSYAAGPESTSAQPLRDRAVAARIGR